MQKLKLRAARADDGRFTELTRFPGIGRVYSWIGSDESRADNTQRPATRAVDTRERAQHGKERALRGEVGKIHQLVSQSNITV